jgi:SAM-dependent methyltransferase
MINIKNTKRDFLDFFIEKDFDKVLDLGCNKGYMSKRFANGGAEVLGVDKYLFEIKQKNFSFIKEDILNFKFKEEYDLIIASLVLNFLLRRSAISLIEKMKKNTKPKGFNFLICISNEDNLALGRGRKYFYPSIKEIVQIYGKEWEIIRFLQDFTEFEEHRNSTVHQHNLIFLIMRKNGQ